MPFLAAAVPALIAGGASAAGGALVNSVLGGGGSNKGTNFQANSGVNPNDVAAQMTINFNDQQKQKALLDALSGQNGIQNQSNVYNQLQSVALGQGPNPAQAMLAQATGANIANQAALMAGQRGAGANAGLLARQAAQQGGALQQNAVGQGASMQAQQSLGALGQLGALSSQQVAQQQRAQEAIVNAGLNEQQIRQQAVLGASGQNAALQGQIAQGQIGAVGGIAQGLGAALTPSPVASASAPRANPAPSGPNLGINYTFAHGGQVGEPQSRIGRHLKGLPVLAHGGKVPALVSPGEIYLDPREAKEVASKHRNPLQVGERIPGKAKVKGDSEKNDVVKKNLDAGGVVVPRTKADEPKKAAKFVQAVMAKGKHR